MESTGQKIKDSYLLHSFRRDKVAMISFAVLLLFLFAALFAPLLSPYNPYDVANIDIMDAELPPSWMEGESLVIFWGPIRRAEICSPPCSMGYGFQWSSVSVPWSSRP